MTTRRKPKGKPEYDGINASSLNVALRRCLSAEAIRGETHVENGVFFHTSKEGFDFSVYDEDYNMARLYNYYQGAIGVLNGDKKIFIKNTENIKFNMVEEDYYNYLKKIRGKYKDELKDLLLEVVEKESLDFKSYVYINSLIQYPYNSMRYLQNNYIKDLKIKRNELEELLVKDYFI